MKFLSCCSVLAALTALTNASPAPEPRALPLVQSNQLRRVLLRSELLKKGKILQDFAYAHSGRNRYIGTSGHTDTVNYLVNQLKALNYYDVAIQPFNVEVGIATLSVNSKSYPVLAMSLTPAGTATAPLGLVANNGCDPADFPATIAGKIALISRGDCTFALKTTNAKAAGAVGAVIYNNVDGELFGTLVEPGPYTITVGLSLADGKTLVTAITGGTPQIATLKVVIKNIETFNVIAQTKGGNKNNVLSLGAHTDSVEAGPGINDNGSGTIALLEIAIQLSKFSTNNAVRFAWWSGEEEGLLGSEHYLASLSEAEQKKIRLYLNFDMIASPNYIYEILDGDGSAFEVAGAPGSAEVEKLWEDYFKLDAKLPTQPAEFDGRSDYGPFIDRDIPAGGISTGADANKTLEEVQKYGGKAGIWYDPNYHSARDTLENVHAGAWLNVAKGIAHAVATYARSFDSIPPRTKRSIQTRGASKFHRKGGKFID